MIEKIKQILYNKNIIDVERFRKMSKEEKFEELYRTLQIKYSTELEQQRKDVIQENRKFNKSLMIVTMTTFIITILSILVIQKFELLSIMFIPILIIIGVIVFVVNIDGLKYEYRKEINYKDNFKSTVMQDLIKSFDDNMEYKYKDGIPPEEYDEGKFEKYQYNRYDSQDLIVGNILNCKMKMAEVIVQNESEEDADGHVHTTTFFKGMFLKCETPKPFTNRIYIRNDIKDKNVIKQLSLSKLPIDKLRVELDSQEFERLFDVYTSDKIVAMQLLTADVMLMLVDFYNDMKIEYEITIRENNIYVRFHTGDLFETAGLKKDVLDKELLHKYYKMFDFMYCLIIQLVKNIDETPYM